jgi:AcrR family transcriptional regulator
MIIPAGSRASAARPRARPPVEAAPREEVSRERIIQAALAAFAERGFHGTSIPDIAVAAKLGVASIYRRFEGKEHLVNAVFRETKGRLRDALLLGLDLQAAPRPLFLDVWARLVRFQRAEPLAFQFLEMQDHVPYLDGESRAVERSLLEPLLASARAASAEGGSALSPPVVMAMIWGAFVGLTKAQRLGYVALDDEALARAGEVCFTALTMSVTGPVAAPSKARRARKGG